MKQILTPLAVIFNMLILSATIQAQCPEIACPDDLTLYLSEGSCTAEYNYTNPAVTDFCHSSNAFYHTGEPQLWVVPDGVTEILVNTFGASGGHGSGPVYELNMGGKGAFATGKVAVNPGDSVYIFVGGKGEDSQVADIAEGGWNGGGDGGLDTVFVGNGAGGGGGATDIRTGGMELQNRVLVAAGGGGASKNARGGAGGAENGIDGHAFSEGEAGIGATAFAGGAVFSTDRGATPGALGQGGSGSTNNASWGGGGGGAGYYGGSGGTATQDHNYGHSGSGGGGSSYIGGVTEGNMEADQNMGHGLAVIYYSNPVAQTAYLTEGPASGSDLGVGTTTFTFAANGAFDTTYCSYDVIVLDTIIPTASVQDYTLVLNEFDEAQLDPADIDNGSLDNCSIETYTLSQEDFDQNHLGANTITLTVEDPSGNTHSASCTVTVVRPPQGLMAQRLSDSGGEQMLAPRRDFQEDVLDIEWAAMKIYPNPTSAERVDIVVELPESWEHARLKVYSSAGQEVISQFVPLIMPKDKMRLPIDQLDAGIYLVQLSTETQSLTERLIIK